MPRPIPTTGQKITNLVGTGKDVNTFKFILKYDKLDLAPVLGDLLLVEQDTRKWVARVEEQRQVSFEDLEFQVQQKIVDEDITQDEKSLYFGEEFIIRLVGILTDKNVSPVIRIYPNRTAQVRYPKQEELQIVTSLDKGQDNIAYLGNYAVGEQELTDIGVKLSVSRFLKRRTAILGQAGFGKSNLIKSVLAEIGYYGDDNAIIIFDIDGEYSFRTNQGIGLADIKNIRDRLVVFTLTERTEKEYEEVLAGKSTLNLKDLSPQEVVNSLFPEGKRGTNYAGWLLSIKQYEIEKKWHGLIDEINKNGLDTDLNNIANIIGDGDANPNSLNGLKNTLTRIITTQHDQDSTLLTDIDEAVNDKRIIIIDLSRMPLDSANGLVETILTRLFRKNEEKFVSGQETIPMLIMVEEAQNFLSKQALKSESNIVVRIAKEGRKYGFGLIYITQQPSAIDETVLSQTNNFFILHLLTQGDIKALTSNNPVYQPVAHYIQSEPLRGYSYFYSNVYSEDGNIQPTTVVFSSKIRKFDDVAKEIDQNQSKHKWQSFFKERQKNREQFLETVISAMDDFYQAEQKSVAWVQFWGTINSKLPLESPYKNGYITDRNQFPDRSAISYAENQLINGKIKDMPYQLSKNRNNYEITDKSQKQEIEF